MTKTHSGALPALYTSLLGLPGAANARNPVTPAPPVTRFQSFPIPITFVEFTDGNETSTGFEIDNFSVLAPTAPDATSSPALLGPGRSGSPPSDRRFRK
jgi:hypothetical protein